MTRCPATHPDHTCVRTQHRAGPHLCHCGTQWDASGVRVRVGNNPYTEKR